MAIQNKDYFTFLGGEVSPNLFKRVDMRAANKWFETAKNIFFDATGGFFNRVGTEIIDNSYSSSEKLKLLKFIYNKEQSYDVVFSQSGVKIYSGISLLSTASFPLNFTMPSDFDIIYTQIGDVMYICLGGTKKIYTLTRYANNDWRFEEFKYDIPPMLDLNSDKGAQISFSINNSYTEDVYVILVLRSYSSISDINVSYKNNSNVYTTIYSSSSTFADRDAFITAFNTGKTEGTDFYMYAVDSYRIKITVPSSMVSSVKSVRIVSDGSYQQYTATGYVYEDVQRVRQVQAIDIDNNVDYLISACKLKISNCQNIPFSNLSSNPEVTYISSSSTGGATTTYYFFEKTFDTPLTIPDFINYVKTHIPCISGYDTGNYIYTDGSHIFTKISIVRESDFGSAIGQFGIFTLSGGGNNGYITYLKREDGLVSEQTLSDSVSGIYYNITAPTYFIDRNNVGDVFCIESLYSPSFDGVAGENKTVSVTNLSAGEGYLPSSNGFWSDGKWRLVTSGLFDGVIELEYSYDGLIWYSHRSFTSSIRTQNNISYSTNYNEYGTLEVDDNVKLRLKYDIDTATNLGITFDTDSFENRSYYQILEKTSSSTAVVKCIKYNIGTPSATYQWAESAWSDTEGYPAVCFTYQNRLCFAKTTNNPFTVWTSRTNDYTDFATKIKYQDDDPITMDVVKFNGISNIATVAALNKLFVFTEDAEFGIQDQGALTQANKSLVSFSKYGAEPIETQVSGNRILFVENGGKAARQLFYDFAQDNYEAPDVTVLYKHLLKDEKIIATDYIGLDYRTYLMLTSTGRVICYKYIPEQEVTACSWFKHAKGTITNISALDVGNNTIRIYMAVDIGSKKQIEVMDLTNESYLDSRHTFNVAFGASTVNVSSYYNNGDVLTYFYNGVKETGTVTEGNITLPSATTEATSITFGYAYESEATLIPVSILSRNGSMNYNKKNLFKANFEYFNSVGFKVGVKDYQDEFEEIHYLEGPIGSENTPHSGEKDDIIIESSYLGKNMLSFKQSEPYKMNITNLQIEVDYGG